tara:strand:+ start:2357 stop:2527 length:171 start_codon:yes stop_codon:yes gene_type:complete
MKFYFVKKNGLRIEKETNNTSPEHITELKKLGWIEVKKEVKKEEPKKKTKKETKKK